MVTYAWWPCPGHLLEREKEGFLPNALLLINSLLSCFVNGNQFGFSSNAEFRARNLDMHFTEVVTLCCLLTLQGWVSVCSISRSFSQRFFQGTNIIYLNKPSKDKYARAAYTFDIAMIQFMHNFVHLQRQYRGRNGQHMEMNHSMWL